MLRPRKFLGFLNREADMGTIVGALNNGEPVSIYAEEGMGKTSLLRQLAYQAPGDNFPHGILYFPVHKKMAEDLLQIIFDHFYESDSPAKPTDAELRQLLQEIQALILLDDALISADDVSELINALPKSIFILASLERCLWGEGCCIELHGLPLREASALIERELKRKLIPAERSSAETLCQLSNGHPLFLIQAAALVRNGKLFEDIVKTFRVSETGLKESLIERLNETQRAILGLLGALKNVAIPKKHLAALTETHNLDSQLKTLRDLRLVQERGAVVSLSGALALPLKQVLSSDWEARGLDYFVGWIGKSPPSSEIGEALDTILSLLEHAFLNGRWEAVVSLGKGIEKTLIMKGFWGAWMQVLEWILKAGGSLSDRALEAWALHQLGTRSLCLGDLATAQTTLAIAMGIREIIGDQLGAAVTQQTIEFSAAAPSTLPVAPHIQPVPAIAKGALPLLKSGLIVCGAVAVATTALIVANTSSRPSDIPPTEPPRLVSQAPVENPLPPVPTEKPAPTETLEPPLP